MIPAYTIIHDRFRDCIRISARIERLYDGCRWAEGPAYFPAHRSLVWSDIPNDRILRWDETNGQVSVFRQPASYANGNTIDRQGRLVTCEHGGRRVTRTEPDGSLTVISDRFDGKRYNTSSSNRTARSGSPTRPTASTPITKAIRPRPNRTAVMFIASARMAR